MNATLKPEERSFRTQLWFWSWRGVLCAAPSFFWAVIAGYNRPAQVIAMLTGVATYILGFAWLTSRRAFGARTGRFAPTLRLAATLRAAWAVLAILGCGLKGWFVAVLIIPDFWAGLAAVSAVEWIGKIFHADASANTTLFALTYLTTLIQGALVSVTMLLLAAGLWVLPIPGLRRGRASTRQS